MPSQKQFRPRLRVISGPAARPAYRVMAAILCVVDLAGILLMARWTIDGSRGWAIVAMICAPYPVAFGHLALTGNWILGRNYRF